MHPKSILTEEGVKVFFSGCSLVYVQWPRWGGVRVMGILDWYSPNRPLPVRWIHTRGESMLRKSDCARRDPATEVLLVGGDFAVLYPVLWQYLTQSRWEDGTERKTSSVTMFYDAGQLKGVLKDRETSHALWAAGDGPESLFGVMEALLNDPTAVWRQDKVENGVSARIKPKRG